MTQDELKKFLTNMKLIYEHGVHHSKNKSTMHRLFAIHNCHYVVEQIIRERAKDMHFKGALQEIGFKAVIKKVHDKQNLQDFNHLLELNEIRNGVEHRNIFPDVDTVRFYVKVTGEFLKWSYENYYEIDYESLAFEDMILDAPIRRAMLEAKLYMEKDDLKNASARMYEGLGAFKFMPFGFLSEPRVRSVSFEGISLSKILADLAFKIILDGDEAALKEILPIQTDYEVKNGKIIVRSYYPTPAFKNKEEAMRRYEEILNIILTYQDKMPPSIWRKKARKPRV
jgi:hypothetical protein